MWRDIVVAVLVYVTGALAAVLLSLAVCWPAIRREMRDRRMTFWEVMAAADPEEGR